jgi:starch synthase
MKTGWIPEILHANDWHTSFSIYAFKEMKDYKEIYEKTSALLTIHNLPYLGPGDEKILKGFNIEHLSNTDLPDWAQVLPLPIGIEYADWINTVSKGYAEEMQTEEFGSGIEKFIKSKSKKINGILNGLDTEYWNPETDKFIQQSYSVNNLFQRIENKKSLLKEIGFKEYSNLPLISIISRFDYQKGIDLLLESISSYGELNFQMVILGSGDPKIEKAILNLQNNYPDKIKAFIRYDEILAHKIYSGADMILIPSRYEPCGLTQMIAMRYGCIPLAADTGGLKDTVIDIKTGSETATGFLFPRGISKELGDALASAINLYSDRAKWYKLQKNGMLQDFSWEKPVREYQNIYEMLNKKRK